MLKLKLTKSPICRKRGEGDETSIYLFTVSQGNEPENFGRKISKSLCDPGNLTETDS